MMSLSCCFVARRRSRASSSVVEKFKSEKDESGRKEVFNKVLDTANAGDTSDILSEIKKRRKEYDEPQLSLTERRSSLERKQYVFKAIGKTMTLYKSTKHIL